MAPAVVAGINLGVGLGTSAYQIYQGGQKKKQAKKLLSENPRPDYEIAQEEFDNMALAEALASQGLSDRALSVQQQGYDRALTSTIDAVLKGGGSVNDIGRAQDRYNQGMNTLAIAEDRARLQNIQNLIAQRGRMTDFKDKQWMINKYAPYADATAAASKLTEAGEKQQWSGIETAASSITGWANTMGAQSKTNEVNKGNAGPGLPGEGAAPGAGGATPPGAAGGGGATAGIDWNSINPENMGMLLKLLAV